MHWLVGYSSVIPQHLALLLPQPAMSWPEVWHMLDCRETLLHKDPGFRSEALSFSGKCLLRLPTTPRRILVGWWWSLSYRGDVLIVAVPRNCSTQQKMQPFKYKTLCMKMAEGVFSHKWKRYYWDERHQIWQPGFHLSSSFPSQPPFISTACPYLHISSCHFFNLVSLLSSPRLLKSNLERASYVLIIQGHHSTFFQSFLK